MAKTQNLGAFVLVESSAAVPKGTGEFRGGTGGEERHQLLWLLTLAGQHGVCPLGRDSDILWLTGFWEAAMSLLIQVC